MTELFWTTACGGNLRRACAIFVRRALLNGMADDGYMSLEVFGATLNGEKCGDWEFTCRRIRKPNQLRPGDDG